jgi:adenosine deaminase
LRKQTVHAGEGFGPESIGQAIKYLHAERIGHGFHLFNWQQVEGRQKSNAKAYVDRLVEWVTDLRITLEVCLTSNENTMPSLKIADHPFRTMVEERVSVTIATDNRLVSNTNTVLELSKAVRVFALTPQQLKEIVITGFKRSFFPGSYADRRRYVRMAMNHFDEVSKKHGVSLS